MDKVEKFCRYLEMRGSEPSLKGKVIVNIIYIILFTLYVAYTEFISLPLYLVYIVAVIITIVIEENVRTNYQYYIIKFMILIFILNLTLLNWEFALALTFLSTLCYLWQRKRELIALYNRYEGISANDLRNFALIIAAGTVVLLKVINISFKADVWWFIILILMNIFFAIEFNLIIDLHDITYVKLLKIDRYIEDRSK